MKSDHNGTSEKSVYFSWAMKLAPFSIRGAEHMIPKTAGDAEVHVWALMMDEMVGPQFPIPSILAMAMMMEVMNDAIADEPSRQAGHETRDAVQVQTIRKDIPDTCQKRSAEGPRHGEQFRRRLVMFCMSGMGCRVTLVIDP